MKLQLRSYCAGRRGSTQVEFVFVALQLFLLLFFAIELGRMVVVSATVANAARIGVRYAIVHGSTRTGTGVDGPSGPGANPPEVVNLVKDYARPGLLDVNKLNINVTYTGGNAPGARVSVKVTYPYDPFVLLPLKVTLGSTTQGVITF